MLRAAGHVCLGRRGKCLARGTHDDASSKHPRLSRRGVSETLKFLWHYGPYHICLRSCCILVDVCLRVLLRPLVPVPQRIDAVDCEVIIIRGFIIAGRLPSCYMHVSCSPMAYSCAEYTFQGDVVLDSVLAMLVPLCGIICRRICFLKQACSCPIVLFYRAYMPFTLRLGSFGIGVLDLLIDGLTRGHLRS
ncbi:hypothetical protein OE88DRAFT_252983 [Heliocybe sulcata]|uniref:Uncharacterized protein n=1 Tax=Heliocybe sulcata TaxID=5364 RepID=A0A5C3N9B5_9AGAM|nr:hypothetical protein OE88DRAFT_252983 [Heliocybe sulcata]